ncbi:MAG: hypothetical protein K5686_00430 [Lachnospiraceae bacterium]|nr:hypothetical protein [Lachnospiraceae bacterium]
MLRMFYADLRSTLRNKGFIECCAGVAVYMAGFVIILSLIMDMMKKGDRISAEEIMNAYSDMGILVVTAATIFVFNTDFADGIIRNKLICGVKRRGIAASSVTCGMIVGALISISAIVAGNLLVPFFSSGYISYTVSEALGSFLVFILSSMSVGAFATMLMMVLGGTKAVYVAGLAIAFGLRVFGMDVMEKLYPESGECLLSGSKLILYRAYDRFVPYAHFAFFRRWAMSDYIIGSAVCILISYLAAVLILERKEIR